MSPGARCLSVWSGWSKLTYQGTGDSWVSYELTRSLFAPALLIKEIFQNGGEEQVFLSVYLIGGSHTSREKDPICGERLQQTSGGVRLAEGCRVIQDGKREPPKPSAKSVLRSFPVCLLLVDSGAPRGHIMGAEKRRRGSRDRTDPTPLLRPREGRVPWTGRLDLGTLVFWNSYDS